VVQSDTAAIESDIATAAIFPAGAIEWPYTVTDSGTGMPVDGVEVWITTDAGGVNVIWSGVTDALGEALDVNGNHPMLDAGTYYFWKQLAGYVDDNNPDVEVVA